MFICTYPLFLLYRVGDAEIERLDEVVPRMLLRFWDRECVSKFTAGGHPVAVV